MPIRRVTGDGGFAATMDDPQVPWGPVRGTTWDEAADEYADAVWQWCLAMDDYLTERISPYNDYAAVVCRMPRIGFRAHVRRAFAVRRGPATLTTLGLAGRNVVTWTEQEWLGVLGRGSQYAWQQAAQRVRWCDDEALLDIEAPFMRALTTTGSVAGLHTMRSRLRYFAPEDWHRHLVHRRCISRRDDVKRLFDDAGLDGAVSLATTEWAPTVLVDADLPPRESAERRALLDALDGLTGWVVTLGGRGETEDRLDEARAHAEPL